jgi:hypothetical protein
MKIKVIKLTSEQLMKLLKGDASAFASNLPADAELLDLKFDLISRQIQAVIRSDAFEDVAEGCPTPELKLTKNMELKAPQKSAEAFKGEPKFEPKPVAAKVSQIAPIKSTTKWENEFSPDQRKLLSFQFKGDCVVVKPIQFLKAEWEDINEVVRSLGGKWVKGDIISYWEIPTNLDSQHISS